MAMQNPKYLRVILSIQAKSVFKNYLLEESLAVALIKSLMVQHACVNNYARKV